MPSKITVINGSLGGESGNTWAVVGHLLRHLSPKAEVTSIHLSHGVEMTTLEDRLAEANGFVFATGTYWDSWGSPLQQFLENITRHEGTSLWLGKPAAVIVTMHSVGGKGVLSRLQGVLSTLGLLIPPMSGIVYSLSNHLALQTISERFDSDLWQLEDLSVVAQNLMIAAESRRSDWKAWPVDRQDPKRTWIV